jgi:hypothetical protein
LEVLPSIFRGCCAKTSAELAIEIGPVSKSGESRRLNLYPTDNQARSIAQTDKHNDVPQGHHAW